MYIKRARDNQFSQFKILNYIDRIQDLSNGKDIWPIMAEIDLTDACNHNCNFCIYSTTRVKNAFLTMDDIRKVIPQLKQIGVKSIVIKGGGEPTISPIFSEALHFIKEQDLKIGLITNGSNINGQNLDAIISCCDWMRISLDAASKKVHEAIHSPTNSKFWGFNNIIFNIKKIIDVREKRNINITIGINYVVCYQNYMDIDKAVKLSKALKVDYICFRHEMCTSEYDEIMMRKIREKFINIEKESDENCMVVTRYQETGFYCKRTWEKCIAPSLITIIQANGDIVACCDARGIKSFVFGNIRSNNFEDIWKSDKRQSMNSNYISPICEKICTDRYRCYNNAIDYLRGIPQKHAEFL